MDAGSRRLGQTSSAQDSELCANDFFSGRAQNEGFVNLRFDDNSLTTATVARLMINLNGEQAYCPVQTQFQRLSHS